MIKLLDCVLLTASALNLDAKFGEQLTDTEKLLIRCANNCLDEITSEYLPLKSEIKVKSTNGSIPYSHIDVVSVTDSKGERVKFTLMPSRIKVDRDDEYTVLYCTRIQTLEINDEIPSELHLSPRIISYGIIAEYLLVTYDTRFKDALKRAISGVRERKVKGRRWLI